MLVRTFTSRVTLRVTLRVALRAALLAVTLASVSRAQRAAMSAWDEVARRLQTADTPQPGYHRYNLPRRDITLMMGDVRVATSLALGSWAGFAGEPGSAMVMGDLVLLPAELKAVLAELVAQRIMTSAIHNHLAGETPELIYVHFDVMGDAVDIAVRLARVVAHTATPLPVSSPPPAPLAIDTAVVFGTLGLRGRAQGAVAQVSAMLVSVPVTMRGEGMAPALAYGSPINVQAIGTGRAVASGDFAVLEGQVAPLLGALVSHGITATAVHSHMIGELPKVYFIHFWADGALGEVCAGLRAALDAAR